MTHPFQQRRKRPDVPYPRMVRKVGAFASPQQKKPDRAGRWPHLATSRAEIMMRFAFRVRTQIVSGRTHPSVISACFSLEFIESHQDDTHRFVAPFGLRKSYGLLEKRLDGSWREIFAGDVKTFSAPLPPVSVPPPACKQTWLATSSIRKTNAEARFDGPTIATWRRKHACSRFQGRGASAATRRRGRCG